MEFVRILKSRFRRRCGVISAREKVPEKIYKSLLGTLRGRRIPEKRRKISIASPCFRLTEERRKVGSLPSEQKRQKRCHWVIRGALPAKYFG